MTLLVFLRNSDALILDMRDTVGGSPELAQYILSYFIEPNIPLWRIEARDSELQSNFASLNTAKHRHFLDNFPVWVLTSNHTASASEIFIGVLQAQQKATVVGDITAGAGFYVGVRSITDELTFRISLAKPVIAVSNINWEKTGLQPDIRVISMDALDTALQDIHQFRQSNQTEAHN
jgi:C-terminal processing protease CtpA/Prc